MNQASPEKLCAPGPILLRLPHQLADRLKAAADTTGFGRQDIIRAGLDEKLARIEAQVPGIPAATAKQVLAAQARGLDVGQILAAALAAADATKAAAA